jgi:tRNA modification GTPase
MKKAVAHIKNNDTIAAISTPLGQGGIGIVRLSGKLAFKIGDRIFKSKSKNKKVTRLPGFTMHYGFIIDKGSLKKDRKKQMIVDEVILSVMRAPYTYTKEDVLEISCHGGIATLRNILELCIKSGARLAQPGEFTQRAFENGRIDLVQAEAVLNVINAKTDRALEPAIDQLQGRLSIHIKNLSAKLIELVAPIEASIDFPDDTIVRIDKKIMLKRLGYLAAEVKKLIDTADKGIMLANGINIVIAGAANVGKSSIMNALLEYERVIVTNISGTTRDVVEEVLNIQGVPVKISDTAGIMDTSCVITKESMNRSLACLQRADLVLWVLDGSRKPKKADIEAAEKIKDKKVIVVINKNDLAQKITAGDLKKILPAWPKVRISALKKHGLKQLEKTVMKMFFQGKISKEEDFLISNIRQKNALAEAYNSINKAINAVKDNAFEECFVFEMKQALESLGEVIGDNVNEEILDNIFSRFCIGK